MLRKSAPPQQLEKLSDWWSVAAAVSGEIPDVTTEYTLPDGTITSAVIKSPCKLIAYMAGLQRVNARST